MTRPWDQDKNKHVLYCHIFLLVVIWNKAWTGMLLSSEWIGMSSSPSTLHWQEVQLLVQFEVQKLVIGLSLVTSCHYWIFVFNTSFCLNKINLLCIFSNYVVGLNHMNMFMRAFTMSSSVLSDFFWWSFGTQNEQECCSHQSELACHHHLQHFIDNRTNSWSSLRSRCWSLVFNWWHHANLEFLCLIHPFASTKSISSAFS